MNRKVDNAFSLGLARLLMIAKRAPTAHKRASSSYPYFKLSMVPAGNTDTIEARCTITSCVAFSAITAYSPWTFLILPIRPPANTTSLPTPKLSISVRCSLARFDCGRCRRAAAFDQDAQTRGGCRAGAGQDQGQWP